MHKKGEREPLSLCGKIRNTVRFGLISATGLRGAWRERGIVKCLSQIVLSMGSLISDFLKCAVSYILRYCVTPDVLGHKGWCYRHSSEEYSQTVSVWVKWMERQGLVFTRYPWRGHSG